MVRLLLWIACAACAVPNLTPDEFACTKDAECGGSLVCLDQRCASRPVCGNGLVEKGEVCDDGGATGACQDCAAVQRWWTCDPTGCSKTQYSLIDAGADHFCAIRVADGLLECFGSNVGIEGDFAGQAKPPNDLGPFSAVEAGNFHTCAIRREDARPVCFGENLGRDFELANQSVVPSSVGRVLQVSAGGTHSCVIREDGSPFCWGDIHGEGDIDLFASPNLDDVDEMDAASFHTCVRVRATQQHVCRGFRDRVVVPQGTFTKLDVGLFHSCVLDEKGDVQCFGRPSGTRTDPPPDPGPYVDVDVGQVVNCALTDRGGVRCWGDPLPEDDFGQSQPPPGTFSSLAIGSDFACGLKTDKTIDCWGRLSD